MKNYINKLVILLFATFFLQTFSFASNINFNKFEDTYSYKLNIIQNNIFKFNDKKIACKKMNNIFSMLDKKINYIRSIKKYIKYKPLLDDLLLINKSKEKNIKNKCQVNNNIIKSNMIINQTKVVEIKKIVSAKDWSKYIKIEWGWYYMSPYNEIIVKWNDLNNIIKKLLSHYKHTDYIFYHKITDDKYDFFLQMKNEIISMKNFNLLEWKSDNIKRFTDLWYNIIPYNKIVSYTKDENQKIIIWWIYKSWSNLYYFILKDNAFYNSFSKDKPLYTYYSTINFYKNQWLTILEDKDRFYLFVKKNSIKIFNLWNINNFDNMNLNKLADIFYMTFYTIENNNIKYNVSDFNNLLNYIKKFKWQNIKEVYKKITNDYKYSIEVKKILNNIKTEKQLWNIVNNNYNVAKYWNIFYVYKNKKWVCATIANIFALINIYNKKDVSIVNWVANEWKYKGLLHKIVKIDNKYYDPTWDLQNNWILSYYSIDKNKVRWYINILSEK